MPSTTTRKLPLEAKTMPSGAKKIWNASFRSSMKEEPEDLAKLVALSAVKKHFRQEGEEWLPRSGSEAEHVRRIAAGEDPAKIAAEMGGDPADPADPGAGATEGETGGEGEKKKVKLKKLTPAEEEQAAQEEERSHQKASKVLNAAKAIREAASSDGVYDVQLTELLAFDSKTKGYHLTEDGFLVAEPRVARTGIQLYKGVEVGAPHMDVVRVYRPETEVFHKKAMASLAHKPITLEHPDTRVDSSNWKELGVGKSDGDVARDGDYIRVPLMLMDSHAIMAAQSGKSQLSVGYGAKLKWGDGITPDGEPYDAMQTEIRANHIALVSTARGGNKLRIGDGTGKGSTDHHDQQRRRPMIERTLTIDGVNITLEDKDGQILERHLTALQKRLNDQEEAISGLESKIEDAETALAEAKKESSTKDGQIVALNQKVEDSKLTPDKLDKALNLRMEVVDRATTFFGDAAKYAWQGKADQQIRRDVVAARLGDAKAKLMNDDAIEGAFLSITETEAQDGFQRLTQSFSRPPVNGGYSDAAAKAYDKRNEELANRFKKNKKPFGATA